MRRVGIVVPTNRLDKMEQWLHWWGPYLEDRESGYKATLYRIDDTPSTWDAINKDLGSAAWIIPCRTDCIRSYGYLQAFRAGEQFTLTFDDDVRPEGTNPIADHVKWLSTSVEPDGWVRTLRGSNCPPTRGLPLLRHIVINHGLWNGIPDVSAATQLAGYTNCGVPRDPANDYIVPAGYYYPMSGMNLGFNTRFTRFMYFTLQGADIRDPSREWGLHRCGDILAGVISKTVVDTMSLCGVHTGEPYVYHDRASDPNINLKLESNAYLVPYIVGEKLRGQRSYLSCAEALFHLRITGVNKDYFRHLSLAMRQWYELTKGEPGEHTRTGSITSSGPVQKPQDAASQHQGLAEG